MPKPRKRVPSKAATVAHKDERFAKGKDAQATQKPIDPIILPLVVGIGASAGGLESLKAFFSSVSSNMGVAFVVVQHLDPTHESLMPVLLSHYTPMPVTAIENKMGAEPNHIYVLPPSKVLKIVSGIFYLEHAPETLSLRTAIDLFFTSLSKDKRNAAIGIILSGAGQDGSEGCKAIKSQGGLVIAQDPTTTAFGAMPQNVITSGTADYVLAPEKIPEILNQHLKGSLKETHGHSFKNEESDIIAFDLILSLLRKARRDDFSSYKKPTLMRRLLNRMTAHKIKSLFDYYRFLEKTPTEINHLHADFLIKTTSFFRNPKSFEVLVQTMLDRIMSEPNRPFRVWIPGCSTGEEAYSIAILLMEQFTVAKINRKIQIFATDIDNEALNFARRGLYTKKIVSHLSSERLKKFFDKIEGKYQIKNEVRANVLFVLHNALRDSPFSKLDLISCRNLFIYFEAEAQKEIIKAFHFALRDSGFLFLGSSESFNKERVYFETVSKSDCIFKRLDGPSRNSIATPLVYQREPLSNGLPLRAPLTHPQKSLLERVKNQLMDEHVPPTMVVNSKFDVLYFFGAINRYLKISEGAPNLNLFSMTRRDLSGKITKAIQTLLKDKKKDSISSIYMEHIHNEETSWVDVNVSILKNSPEQGIFIVAFKERSRQIFSLKPSKDSLEALERENFEHELSDVRVYLQSAIEDLQAANEGLKIYNEELMSANEELQASSEEMETSKEELQSLNEELTLVNAQFQEKIEEQVRTNNDLTNLFRSTDIATLFLDDKLCLKRYTQEALKIFNFIDSDIGRPVKDITMHVDDDYLMIDAQKVLEKDLPIEREIKTETGEWFLRKCLAYKTNKGVTTGVVVTFSNVRALVNTQKLAQDNERVLLEILDALPIKISYIDQALKCRFSNKMYSEWVGLSSKELVGHSLETLTLPQPYETIEPYIMQALEGKLTKFDTKVPGPSGIFLYEETILIPDKTDGKDVKGFFIVMFDITERQRAALNQLVISHNFLKAIINAVPDPVCVIDDHSRLIAVNKTYCEKLNKTEGELLGCDPHQLFSKQKAIKVLSEDKEGFSKGVFQSKQKGFFLGKAEIHIVKKIMFESQTHEKYLVCSYQNVTELDTSKDKLKKLVQKLKSSNDELENFAYVCSHDLQEPARTISSFAELFYEQFSELVDEEGKKYLYFLLDGSKRMLRMIDGALSYAKINDVNDINVSINCEELLAKVLENLHASIAQTKVVITHDRLPVLMGDPIKLTQLFQNLISNALKFNNKQTPLIHIGVKLTPSGYTFSVKDNGIGINMDYKGRLFELFYRLNKREEYPGTGIGLAISKKIVDSWGGKIWLESELDKGTTFHFSIPLKR
jgi:two-component system CheB/CheR fusion protein